MFIGKWNASVILSYIGMGSAIAGMRFSFAREIENALSCLIVSGVCDLFDGMVARRIKRTKEEELFGIELDSLVDVVSFGLFPILIFLGMGFSHPFFLPLYIFFGVCVIARLSYFNISAREEEISCYRGLPVTYTALILPFAYLLRYLVSQALFQRVFPLILFLTAVLHILDIRISKPRGAAYPFFALLAICMLFVYQKVLR